MSSPVLEMLVERLLWPLPRVRWEVARSLARLIREGDMQARCALVYWLHNRRLESEALMVLGIIDAFDLGEFFDYAKVSNAVVLRSHASTFLLRRNFGDAQSANPFGYSISPSDRPVLARHEQAWFDQYRCTAIPGTSRTP